MSRLRKRVVPFRWSTITASFVQGTASTISLSTFLTNTGGLAITYAVGTGSLPSGVTLSTAGVLSYNGTGAVASSTVQFRASSGVHVADSASTSVGIAAYVPTNRAPVWSGTTSLGSYSNGSAQSIPLAAYASDPDADPLTFTRQGGTAPAGVTVNASTGVLTIPLGTAAGSYTVTVRASDASLYADRTFSMTVTAASGTVVFFDDFDYVLDRVASSTTKRNTLLAEGYTFYKDENYSAGSNGYIYTATSVPGYAGTLPGTGPRVMTFESRGGTEGQTDYYVQLGNGQEVSDPALASIPPDVWFQFWMYLAPGNAPSGKWLYLWPAAPGTRSGQVNGSVVEMPFLTTNSGQTFEPSGVLTTAPTAGWYTFNTEVYGAVDPPNVGRTNWPSDVRWKVGPNLRTGDDRWLRPGIWYLHRMHFNVSGGGNSWEWWVREMGTLTFTKWAEYIHGTTANFTWPTQTTHDKGFRQLKMPTTNSNDSTQYLRDFAIATSADALPTYGSY